MSTSSGESYDLESPGSYACVNQLTGYQPPSFRNAFFASAMLTMKIEEYNLKITTFYQIFIKMHWDRVFVKISFYETCF